MLQFKNFAVRLSSGAAAILCAGLLSGAACAQSVAFSFDDGPSLAETPRLSPQQRNQAMLDALAKHKVKAALFVTAGNGADKRAGHALARAWGEAGHAIGNHTMTHPDLDSAKISLAQYWQEVMDCDKIIASLPGYQKWFRFTYLREGNTPGKRDGMRAFLAAQGYRNAYVSLDTSDWRLDDYLTELLAKNSKADLAPLKKVYLAHVRQRALAYRALSQRLQGRDIAQVILMHHNLINALFLDDVISMFKEMGWTIVSPAKAFEDPVYQLAPQRAAPGQSLLLSMSRSLGVDKFDGWERLVDDGDADIASLKAQGY
ncbi:polysaccharide deacetylase family protein [Massilia pseudoviolaceinigra]|uniref:polysaccharide deacetylase family protein n=1 Tax=Massilia pseudoviolaceinigra TaxID=3057165 RepID=UPI002796A002|nr:polysaccharide deacetylase family protein [Massilia sp. CCM 9206]MDQ1921050.1 polysaccharide deacetylase family protein [Massilia sp. CCM 9206]